MVRLIPFPVQSWGDCDLRRKFTLPLNNYGILALQSTLRSPIELGALSPRVLFTALNSCASRD